MRKGGQAGALSAGVALALIAGAISAALTTVAAGTVTAAGGTATAATSATVPARTTPGPRFESVTLGIFHRVYHDFKDAQRVKLNKDFLLGDTEYSARVAEYVPDFFMDLKTHTITSRSDRPENPAFRIIVTKGGVPQDTTWALFKMAPHFARRSFFGFRVMRIDFQDHTSMVADTTAMSGHAAMPPGAGAATPQAAGSPHTTASPHGAPMPAAGAPAATDSSRHP